MKKSICFAGFSNDDFESLKKAMAGIEGAWDCIFVGNAKAALDAISARPADALVANIHMEGMNGAELLRRARELHPNTLRFAVGEAADREPAQNCIAGPHQFITRPFKPHELILAIQRSVTPDAARGVAGPKKAASGDTARISRDNSRTQMASNATTTHGRPGDVKSHRFLEIFVPAAVAIAIVAAITFVWRRGDPRLDRPLPVNARSLNAPARTDAVTGITRQAQSGTAQSSSTEGENAQGAGSPAIVPPPPPAGFDSIKVQGIFYSVTRPSVIINGKFIGLHGRINGVEVVSIQPATVVLTYKGERRAFQVK
jgi:CheY-like chemotaxis protein